MFNMFKAARSVAKKSFTWGPWPLRTVNIACMICFVHPWYQSRNRINYCNIFLIFKIMKPCHESPIHTHMLYHNKKKTSRDRNIVDTGSLTFNLNKGNQRILLVWGRKNRCRLSTRLKKNNAISLFNMHVDKNFLKR